MCASGAARPGVPMASLVCCVCVLQVSELSFLQLLTDEALFLGEVGIPVRLPSGEVVTIHLKVGTWGCLWGCLWYGCR